MQRLAEVVDFEALLSRDEALAAQDGTAALVVRDRALAPQLGEGPIPERLERWTGARRRIETDLPGSKAHALVTIVAWVLGILGAAVGASASAGLLAYDGRSPVNVLAFLLYTTGIPFALGVLLILGLLVPARFLPHAGAGQALLASVVEPLLARLPGASHWAPIVFGRHGGAGLRRALLVGLTQIFTLTYLTGAIVMLFVKITITDLTFSWSTTLDLSDAEVTSMVQGLAAPWADIIPSAVPDESAVAQSNYRRFIDRFRDTNQRTAVDATVGATWWKLSLMAMLVYGVLPRALLLAWARFKWRRELRRWPNTGRPEVSALLDRLGADGGAFSSRRTIKLEVSGPSSPAEAARGDGSEPTLPSPAGKALGPPMVVLWGAAAADRERALGALPHPPDLILTAGADLDLEAEQRALERAAERGGPVQVLIPLTEPPIEDVLGFLRELRAVTSEVLVVAIQKDGEGWQTTTVDDVWTRALTRVRGVEAKPA